jgi:hypothetical protein
MQLHSDRTFRPRPFPKEVVPYSSAALRQDLERVRSVLVDLPSQPRPQRDLRVPQCRVRPGGVVDGGGP